ncbi:MAG: hypothetical protein E6Q25_00945 [Acinetobacter sp.]|jgi:hypothetical protein|nr:MAG: hypothetical protein E6Q25_00945 [Acinetobacter sp.]
MTEHKLTMAEYINKMEAETPPRVDRPLTMQEQTLVDKMKYSKHPEELMQIIYQLQALQDNDNELQ